MQLESGQIKPTEDQSERLRNEENNATISSNPNAAEWQNKDRYTLINNARGA